MASPQEMYGRTYKLHNSPGLAPTLALYIQSSLVVDGLQDDIKIFNAACSYRRNSDRMVNANAL